MIKLSILFYMGPYFRLFKMSSTWGKGFFFPEEAVSCEYLFAHEKLAILYSYFVCARLQLLTSVQTTSSCDNKTIKGGSEVRKKSHICKLVLVFPVTHFVFYKELLLFPNRTLYSIVYFLQDIFAPSQPLVLSQLCPNFSNQAMATFLPQCAYFSFFLSDSLSHFLSHPCSLSPCMHRAVIERASTGVLWSSFCDNQL